MLDHAAYDSGKLAIQRTLLGRGYVASLYILYFGFLASLAWGAFEASARRRRAASA